MRGHRRCRPAKEGVWDLRRAGLEKVKNGLTSLEEVNSVTSELATEVTMAQATRSSHLKKDVAFNGRAWTRRASASRAARGARASRRCARSCAARAWPHAHQEATPRRRRSGGKVKAEDIAIFSRQLATMLAAGIPLVQAFEIVGSGHDKPAMQKLVLDIKADVEGGTSLHEALAKHPLYFDDLFVNLVEAGEQAGALETMLDKIATYKEKTEAIKKKVKKALFYPAAVLVVAVIVTIILLIFVIPQFEDLFKGFGADLPAFTQMVINLSKFVQHNGIYIAVVVGGAAFAFIYFKKRSRKMREFLDRGVAEVADHRTDPQQGGDRALRAYAVDHVRGRRAAGRSARIGGRRLRQHRLRRCRAEDARRGRHRPAPAARHGEHRLFPNMVVQMIAVGEESGSLDAMSGKVATSTRKTSTTRSTACRACSSR
jgi:type IV pilus assembly protein PilC